MQCLLFTFSLMRSTRYRYFPNRWTLKNFFERYQLRISYCRTFCIFGFYQWGFSFDAMHVVDYIIFIYLHWFEKTYSC